MAKKRGRQITKTDDIIDESEWDVVFTDGACQRNGRVGAVAGIGVWWGVNDPRFVGQHEESESIAHTPQGIWPNDVLGIKQIIVPN